MKTVLYSIIASLCLVLSGCSTAQSSKDQKHTPVAARGPEGTMIVNPVSLSRSIFSEGQKGVDALSFSVEVKQSDLAVQRVKIDLGSEREVYTDLIKAMYLADSAGKIVAWAELNDNTVVYDSGRYYLTLGGFESIVQKDAKSRFTIKVDFREGIKPVTATFATLRLQPFSVRAIDEAKIDQYGPGSGFIAQNVSVKLRPAVKG